jgi:hypothetical protein
VLLTIGVLWPDGPLLAYQLIPPLAAILGVGIFMFFSSRRGGPKQFFDRQVEPLASRQVWAGVPLVVVVAITLSFIHLPAQADTSVRSSPGPLVAGQPLVAPAQWRTRARENFRQIHRYYGDKAVLVRQEMVAEQGDPRFDKLLRPRTVVVDSIVSRRPFSFDVYPARVIYDMTGARLSESRTVDLGYGVTGQMLSVVDDNLLVTWNTLRFAWGDSHLAQRVSIFAVDDHAPGAPFPRPSETMMSTLRTLFTLLFRGNAVLDERTPSFKDAELLTEFGRQLVAAQFARTGR